MTAPDALAARELYDVLKTADGVLDALERLTVPRQGVLIEQGSDADALYLVETGRFEVRRNDIVLAEIGPGETAGEIGLFTGGPRTASVIAARDSTVLKLSAQEYRAACAENPDFAQAVARVLAQRLTETSARVRQSPSAPKSRSVTILPAGGAGLPGGLLASLVTALAQGAGARAVFRSDLVPEGASAVDADAAAEWMHAQEASGQAIIYVADADDDDWTRLALRQSDQVLIVGMAGDPPEMSETERFAFDIFAQDHRRLALIHPEHRDWVTGTEHWLDSRPVFMHHHIAEGDQRDIDRLGRFLTGRALGFVASGGGAFGALHTGIYQALRDRGLSFDIFGGTSVGSAMTAAFAMGLDGHEIDARTGDIFVTNAAMGKLTVPRYSLLDHTVFDAQIRKHYTANLIENLWYPFFAVATDLSENTAHIIRRGPLWEAVRASSAIPGVLPPFYTSDGRMLADGGSMDNMPYRQMHALKSGPNVVVSFPKPGRQRFQVDYKALPGRWSLLRKLIWPFGKRPPRAPGIVPVVMRSILVRQASEPLDLAPGDWHIQASAPSGTGFLDWRKHNALFKAGFGIVEDQVADRGADDARAAILRMAR
ncbi:patatin-like phospholipase family protein [Anianabacter salinae]|uniref:patatin-like phospholipase family protein n=1 Tax=Anianabacter salinae TaxID=2851023 RepID=UPI00225DCDCE|nr:patatin-like phospholipase family protein [Anianabacter salinae]MBV0913940.1 patatin-like phospholipase family protein [Anianabacter salinae]